MGVSGRKGSYRLHERRNRQKVTNLQTADTKLGARCDDLKNEIARAEIRVNAATTKSIDTLSAKLITEETKDKLKQEVLAEIKMELLQYQSDIENLQKEILNLKKQVKPAQ